MGAQARKEAEEYKKVVAAGFTKRSELAKEGDKLVKEKTGGIDELKKELEELQPLKTAAETKKNEAEEKEKAAKEVEDKAWEEKKKELKRAAAEPFFAKLDSDGDNKLTIQDFKKIIEFDTDGNGEVSDDEAKSYMNGADELDFETFFEKSFDELRVILKPKEPEKKESTEEPKAEKEENDEGEDLEDEYSAPPESERAEDEWEKRPPYSEATQKLIDEATQARNEFHEALRKVSDLEVKIRDAEQFIEFDYGPDHAWAALKGQCFDLDENQYTYRLCMFDKTTQKDRNSHHDVSLGYWNSWAGPESDKYSVQKYDRGQSCWNGPERSTMVEIKCGEETKLLEASEPAKCEYKFVISSPAACQDPAKLEENYHSEL